MYKVQLSQFEGPLDLLLYFIRRDEIDIDGLMFAFMQTNSNWGWLDDGFRRDELLNNENCISYRAANDWDNIEFEDYNVIVINSYNQQSNAQYNNNLERFEEYIDAGGAAYFEMGNTNAAVRAPGGVYNDFNRSSSNGTLLVSPDPADENYSRFAEICQGEQPNNWNAGEIIEGSAWLHSGFQHGQFEDGVENGTLSWFQPIASMQNAPNDWGAVSYGFGGGVVMVVGHPSGHCWFNYNQVGMWGSIASELLYYLSTEAGLVNWFSWDPQEGTVDAGGNRDVIATFDATGLLGGDYSGILNFYSNDPIFSIDENGDEVADVEVAILMNVRGIPVIDVTPGGPEVDDEGNGEPPVDWALSDWGVAYVYEHADADQQGRNGFVAEPVMINVANVGTQPLDIEGIDSDNEMFWVNEQEFVLEPDEEREIAVWFAPEDAGEYETELIFITNDEREEFADGYPVTIVTTALFPPVLFVEDEEMGADLNNGESQEIVLNIGNDTDDGDDLIWWTEFVSNPENPIVEEERDRQVRSARRIDGVAGPRRDEAGDLLGSFNGNNGANQYSSCVGWDPENEWMWVSNYITATCVAWIPDGNYENFEQGPALQGPGSCMDGTFANGMVYLGAWANASVGLWDAEGARIRNIQFPHAVYGLGADQENGWLFAMNSNNQNIHVYLFDEDGGFGDQIGIIDGAQHRQFHNNYASYGLEWVGEHADTGQLWMNDGPNNNVHQILVDTDEWDAVEEVMSFPVGNIANQYGAAAHDGVNMWESGYGAADVRIYDDGNAEMPPWFQWEPQEGGLDEDNPVIEPGADRDIICVLDAGMLAAGAWEGELRFYSNDPIQPEPLERWDADGFVIGEDDDYNDEVPANEEDDQADAFVAVTLVVHGAPVWEFANEDGNVDAEQQRIEFPQTYVGATTVYVLEARNVGTDALDIFDFAFDDDDVFFIDEFDPEVGATIPPGEMLPLTFLFSPQDVGEWVSEVEVSTNIDNNADGSIFIEIGGSQGAAIAVTPPIINVNLEGNDIENGFEWEVFQELPLDENEEPIDLGGEDYALVISNVGGDGADDLHWDIDLEIVEMEDEGRDRVVRSPRRFNNNAIIQDGQYNGPPSDSPVWNEGYRGVTVDGDPRYSGPRRDDPPPGNYALFYERNGWGYNMELLFSNFEGLEYTRFQNWNADFDLNDFDAIWINNYESDQWNRDYMEHLEEVEEYIARGGALYHCVGTNNGFIPTHPGGLQAINGNRVQTAFTVAEPEDCFMFELLEWDVGQQLTGNSFNHESYPVDRLDDLDGEYQVLVATAAQNGVPIVVRYEFGGGHCVVSGTTDGFLHNNQAMIWGSQETAEALIWYLDDLANSVRWLALDPREGTLAPGEDAGVTITVNAFELEFESDYYANLLINSNDVDDNPFIISVHLFTGQGGEDPPWDIVGEDALNNHSVLVGSLTYEGEEVDDWWVAAFDNDQGNLCVGEPMQWDAEGGDIGLVLWQDDPDTEIDEGYENGQSLKFRMWDPFAAVEYKGGQVTFDIAEGPRNWVNNELTIMNWINAANVSSIVIDFRAGWNLISINVEPGQDMYDEDEERGADIIKMMTQFADDPDDLRNTHHVTLMKNGRGFFYTPAHNFNGIPYWDVTQGYQVRMDQAIQGEWVGNPIAADADVPLGSGWNMIAYFPNYELPMNVVDRNDRDNERNFYAIRPIIDFVQIMKNGSGRFAIPPHMYSGMEPLVKGQGYQIRVTEDVVLNSPQELQEGGQAAAVVSHDNAHWTAPQITGDNMSVLVTKVEGQMLNANAQIAAVSNDGAIVGVAKFNEAGQAGLAVWGDDQSTDNTVEGLVKGQEFKLVLWNGEVELDLASNVTLGKMTYEVDEFSIVDVTVQAAIPGEFYLSQAYPNPFNNVTRLTYGLPEAADITVNVFDVAGRIVATLIDGQQVAGHHTVVWNGRDAASGIYLIRMESASFTSTRKLMLVK